MLTKNLIFLRILANKNVPTDDRRTDGNNNRAVNDPGKFIIY